MHTGDNMNIYFCRWIGTGSESDPYRTTIYDHLAAASLNASGSYDLRRAPNAADGWCVVWLPIVSEAGHAAIIADPLCHYIDPLAADGVGALNFYDVMDSPVVLALLQQRGVDVSSVSSTSTVVDVLRLAFPGMS